MAKSSRRYRDQVRRLAAVLTGAVAVAGPVQAGQCIRGINLAGAEFGSVGQPFGEGYTYPSDKTIGYFHDKGFNGVRLPFLWERLQPKLYDKFDATELRRLKSTIKAIRSAGMQVIIDPHNYARYKGELIGSDAVPQSAFADFWRRLAAVLANQDGIILGLMNEPHGISAEDWLSAANGAIAAIRQTGAGNLILVPGTSWTGAHSWASGDYGTPNGSVMSGVVDPSGNYAYEVHQYFDVDFSGKNDECSRAADAVQAITTMGDWLAAQGRRGFLGEFAVPTAPACQQALTDVVAAVESRPDVWLGWAYWAAGDWWKPSEPLNIQPTDDGDRPQMQTLQRYFTDHNECGEP